MFNLEILIQTVQALLANKLRSSLTLLALVIGVSVLVSTTAVAILDNYFKDLKYNGGDVITVSRYPAIQWVEILQKK